MADLLLTRSYVNALTGDEDTPMHWVALRDPKESPRVYSYGPLSEVEYELLAAESEGWDIYVCVNQTDGKGTKDENVTAIRACFVDFDKGPPPWSIINPACPPCFIVYSARGPHYYWLLDGATIEEFKRCQVGLSLKWEKYGADERCKNPARLMRVPGFLHQKSGTVVGFEPLKVGNMFVFGDMDDSYGPLEIPKTVEPKPGTDAKDESAAIECAKKWKPGVLGEHGDSSAYRLACRLKDFGLNEDESFSLMYAYWNPRCKPPWSSDELRLKVKNGYLYGKNGPGCDAKPEVIQMSSVVSVSGKKSEESAINDSQKAGSSIQKQDIVRLAPAFSPLQDWDDWEFGKEQAYVPTGIPGLDSRIGGLAVGQVTLVSGYTGVGKSEFARQLRCHAVSAGHPVVHVDVELGRRILFERRLSQLSGVPFRSVRKKELTEEEWQRIRAARPEFEKEDKLVRTLMIRSGEPLIFVEEAISAALKELRGGNGSQSAQVPLVILDSAQRLSSGSTADGPRLQVTEFFIWCEGLARVHDVALLAVCEQKRSPEGREPRPADFLTSVAESRSAEYCASAYIALWPEKVDEDDDDPEAADDFRAEHRRKVRIYIPKGRDGYSGRCSSDLELVGPCWRMEIKGYGERLAEEILEAMSYDKRMSADAIVKITKRRRKDVLSSLTWLSENGRIVRVGGYHGGWQKVRPGVFKVGLTDDDAVCQSVPKSDTDRKSVSSGVRDPMEDLGPD